MFNICSFLNPHIMKVGGFSNWHQNSIDDSPTWGNIKSRRIFHPTLNQLTLWPFESWILPQNTQKYDEIWQGPFNFFKYIPGNSLSHMGLSFMAFWSKYKDPPTFMKCGITILKILRKLPIVRPFNWEEITQCIDT